MKIKQSDLAFLAIIITLVLMLLTDELDDSKEQFEASQHQILELK